MNSRDNPDIADIELLQELSSELIHAQDIEALYRKIIAAAVRIMRSDFASMQMYYPERGTAGELRLLAFHGFDPESAKFWEWVRADSQCTCGQVLKTGKRAIAADVANCDFMMGSADQAALLKAGMLAAQSTPLISRGGNLVGMISTHWSRPHAPSLRDLRLIDIVARQAADLIERHKAQEDAQRSARRKDEFLAMLAHELRNPLAPISNAVELLKCDASAQTVEMARGILQRQLHHLVSLVDDLLDVARITSGHIVLDRAEIALREVLRNAVELSQPSIQAGRHRLQLDVPDTPMNVFADAVRLTQVIANLLNNSARYTPAGGDIRVTVRVDGAMAEIAVRDNGQGISAEMLPRVFDLFVQANSAANRPARAGLGVGLPLAKRLVEMHGGTIEGRSEGLGRGSEFIVRLALVQPVAEATLPQPASSAPPQVRRRVLVVDDNVDAADSLSLLLKHMGHEVHTAYDASTALAAAESLPPEVVLLDLSMPETDGYTLAVRLRKATSEQHPMRIIALTGHGLEQHRRRSREEGFDEHLVKPVPQETLSAAIASGSLS